MTLEAPKRPHRRTRPLPVAVQTGKRKTVLNSDSLTGQYLEAGRPTYIVATPDTVKRRKPRYLEADGDLVHAPLVIHRHAVEGRLGGLEYSAVMSAYFAGAEDELRREKRAIDRAALEDAMKWWTTPYGRDRVRRGLLRKYDDATARNAFEMVLTYHREQADLAVIAVRFKTTAKTVEKLVDDCMKIAGYHRKGCGCEKCSVRQAGYAREAVS